MVLNSLSSSHAYHFILWWKLGEDSEEQMPSALTGVFFLLIWHFSRWSSMRHKKHEEDFLWLSFILFTARIQQKKTIETRYRWSTTKCLQDLSLINENHTIDVYWNKSFAHGLFICGAWRPWRSLCHQPFRWCGYVFFFYALFQAIKVYNIYQYLNDHLMKSQCLSCRGCPSMTRLVVVLKCITSRLFAVKDGKAGCKVSKKEAWSSMMKISQFSVSKVTTVMLSERTYGSENEGWPIDDATHRMKMLMIKRNETKESDEENKARTYFNAMHKYISSVGLSRTKQSSERQASWREKRLRKSAIMKTRKAL